LNDGMDDAHPRRATLGSAVNGQRRQPLLAWFVQMLS
jgi:hypothetical protein